MEPATANRAGQVTAIMDDRFEGCAPREVCKLARLYLKVEPPALNSQVSMTSVKRAASE